MILNFVFGLLLKGDMLFFRNQLWMCESFSAAYGTFQADEDVILHWQVPYTRTKSTWYDYSDSLDLLLSVFWLLLVSKC